MPWLRRQRLRCRSWSASPPGPAAAEPVRALERARAVRIARPQEGPGHPALASRSAVPTPFHAIITTSGGASRLRSPRRRPPSPVRTSGWVAPEPRDRLERRRDRVEPGPRRERAPVARPHRGTRSAPGCRAAGRLGSSVPGHGTRSPRRTSCPRRASLRGRRHHIGGAALRGTRPRSRGGARPGADRTEPRPAPRLARRRSCSRRRTRAGPPPALRPAPARAAGSSRRPMGTPHATAGDPGRPAASHRSSQTLRAREVVVRCRGRVPYAGSCPPAAPSLPLALLVLLVGARPRAGPGARRGAGGQRGPREARVRAPARAAAAHWRGWRPDRGAQLSFVPKEPNFVGSGSAARRAVGLHPDRADALVRARVRAGRRVRWTVRSRSRASRRRPRSS